MSFYSIMNLRASRRPSISYRPIRPSDLEVLRKLHGDLFPIRYEDEFFLNVVHGHDIVSWGAVDRNRPDDANDELIGFVTARIVMAKESEVCEIDPGIFRDCDALVRNLQGRSEILAISVHGDGDIHADDVSTSEETKKSTEVDRQLTEKMQKATLAPTSDVKHCTTCDALVGDAKQYREHFKSDWHKHNLKRKTRQLPPLSAEECVADVELADSKSDLSEYSF